jgi:Holliday junction resolvase RusA-like endonuclease
MSVYSFFVPGLPIAQPRHRVGVFRGHARTYLPASHPVNAFKALVQLKAAEVMKGAMMDGPVRMELAYFFPRPASMTKKRGNNQLVACVKKPDCDNLAKSVADALNGIAYKDDAQIAELYVRKLICSPETRVGVSITIQTAYSAPPL